VLNELEISSAFHTPSRQNIYPNIAHCNAENKISIIENKIFATKLRILFLFLYFFVCCEVVKYYCPPSGVTR